MHTAGRCCRTGNSVFVNHALSYIQPDAQLRTGHRRGPHAHARGDAPRSHPGTLADGSLQSCRACCDFFRDFFDYDLGGYIRKDNAALARTGVSTRGNSVITARCSTPTARAPIA